MFPSNEMTETIQQQSVLDDYLEKAAEIIAAQTMPASVLMAAKAHLVRKVQEFAELAHDHMARQRRMPWPSDRQRGAKMNVLPRL